MPIPLQLLILEDNPIDVRLMLYELRRDGFELEWRVVETEADYLAHLTLEVDVILADYTLPAFDALRALTLLQDRQLDIPFIVVTGTISEEVAVTCMKQGATDYLLKDRLARLGEAVRQALHARHLREQARQSAKALLASEERYRRLFADAPIGLSTKDHTGRITSVNRAMCAIVGYTEMELVTRTFRDITHPDDLSDEERLLAELVDGSRSVYHLEKRYIRKSGETVWVRLTCTLLEAWDSMHYTAFGMIEDITERRQQEEALRFHRDMLNSLFDGLDDGLLLLDQGGIVLAANRALCRMLGHSSEELVRQPWQKARLQVTPPFPAPWVLDTLRDGHARSGQETYAPPGIPSRVLDIHTIPLVGNASYTDHIIVYVKDVTEQLQLQSMMIQNERFAASGKLAAMVAHEINTPLQSIQSCLYLASNPQDPQRDSYLQLAREELNRIGTIVNQMLDLYRFREPGQVERVPLNLHRLLERVLLLISNTLVRKGIRVERDLAAELPSLPGNANEVTQALLNLVVNAIDAMPNGGTLHIRTNCHQPDSIVLSITDTGVGIPPKIQSTIFDPFFTTKPHGSGLGLAVVQQIMSRHGGTVTVSSTPDEGSTFTLTFTLEHVSHGP